MVATGLFVFLLGTTLTVFAGTWIKVYRNYERNNTWVEGVDVYEGEKYDGTSLTGNVVDFWTRNH